jgi:hypothetical protein
MEYYSLIKKKKNHVTCKEMDGTGDYHVNKTSQTQKYQP